MGDEQNPVVPPPAGQGQSTATPAGQSGGQQTPETFSLTSAQLAERLSRAEESALDKLFKKLGVKNADDIDTVLKSHADTEKAKKEAEDAKKDELQKANDKYAALEAQLKAANDQITAFVEKGKKDQRNNLILDALQKAKADDTRNLLVLLEVNQAELVNGVVDAEGKADEKAIEKLVKTARESHPKFFTPAAPGLPSNRGGQAPFDPNRAAKLARAFKPRF